MTTANDSVNVTPGAGAAIATHTVNAKEHQVVVIARPDGELDGSSPVYRLTIPPQAVGASKVFADLFNATGSAKVLRVLSAIAFVNSDTAVSGTVGLQVSLTRTTAVGSGGTAATADGTSQTAGVLSKMDTASAALPAQITARVAPAGGATAGAVLGTRHLFTEETSAPAGIAGTLGAEFVKPGGEIIVRENTGLRFVQGTVASVGSLGFEITFEAIG